MKKEPLNLEDYLVTVIGSSLRVHRKLSIRSKNSITDELESFLAISVLESEPIINEFVPEYANLNPLESLVKSAIESNILLLTMEKKLHNLHTTVQVNDKRLYIAKDKGEDYSKYEECIQKAVAEYARLQKAAKAYLKYVESLDKFFKETIGCDDYRNIVERVITTLPEDKAETYRRASYLNPTDAFLSAVSHRNTDTLTKEERKVHIAELDAKLRELWDKEEKAIAKEEIESEGLENLKVF